MIDVDALPTDVDMLRTRVMLARRQGEHERLESALRETGLTSFADQAEWLMDHWSEDQRLAWTRRWRRLGLKDPEPRASHFDRSPSLAQPKRAYRREPKPVIPVDRQMEIALAALEKARQGGKKAA